MRNMKKRKFAGLFAVICLVCMCLLIPVHADAKRAPRKLTLNRKELILYTGEVRKLSVVSVKPKNASSKVKWKSKNSKIVKVSAKGKAVAKKAGTTEITAFSKKNPKIRATVKVKIRKRPKRVEKECTYTGSVYELSATECSAWDQTAAENHVQRDNPVIHTKEDFRVLMKALKTKGIANYRKTFPGMYEGTDFKNSSLVFLRFSSYRNSGYTVRSVFTQFDASGRLCGTVKLQHMAVPEQPGMAYPQVMDENMVVLKLNKKDAAMIDYFKLTDEEKP